MGITAFVTAFFPGITLETLRLLIDTARKNGSISEYLQIFKSQLVALSFFVFIPAIIGLLLFFSLACIIPACYCGRRRCYTSCTKCGFCCYVTQFVACGVGLAGCLGMFIASAQPIMGMTNSLSELNGFVDKVDMIAGNTESIIDSMLSALFIYKNNTQLTSPFKSLFSLDSQQIKDYVNDISTKATIRPIYELLAIKDSSLAAKLSTLLSTHCESNSSCDSSVKVMEDFVSGANTILNLLRDTTNQSNAITDLQSRKAYTYFETSANSPTNASSDKITEDSIKHVNKNSTVGGAVYALNSITFGVNNSLKQQPQPPPPPPPQPNINKQWETIIETVAKMVFISDNKYNEYKGNSSKPIDRGDLKVPKSKSSSDVSTFIISQVDSLIQDAAARKTVKAFLQLFTKEVRSLVELIKSVCTSDLKDKLSQLCTNITANSNDDQVTDAIIGLFLPGNSLEEDLRDIFNDLVKTIPYFNYTHVLKNYKNQLNPRFIFDAFINNGECPYFITGIAPLLGFNNITTCTFPDINEAPSWMRNYNLLVAAGPLIVLILLLVPITVFILGILGGCCRKRVFFLWSNICNSVSMFCLILAFLTVGIFAVILGKLIVVPASSFLDNPERFLHKQYQDILSLLVENKVLTPTFTGNISIDFLINQGSPRASVHPGLLYTTPNTLPIDISSYSSLKATGHNANLISIIGDFIGATLSVSLPMDDKLYTLNLSTPLRFSSFSLTDLLYYNKKRRDLLEILGFSDVLSQIEDLLPRLIDVMLDPNSFIIRKTEDSVVGYLLTLIQEIIKVLNDSKTKAINMFLETGDGYSLFKEKYSTSDKRSALYASGSSGTQAMSSADLYKLCASYLEGFVPPNDNIEALSPKTVIDETNNLRGITGECIAFTQFVRGLVFSAGCNVETFDEAIKYNTNSSERDKLCTEGGIADYMKSLRTALNNLNTSCLDLKKVLLKALKRELMPIDIEKGCQKMYSGSSWNGNSYILDQKVVNERMIRTFPAFSEALVELLARGVTIFGWDATLTEEKALDLILDTTRAYERFTTVFSGWSEFNTATVEFVNAYSNLISTVFFPLYAILDTLFNNIISARTSGALTPGFSTYFDEAVLAPFRDAVKNSFVIPFNNILNITLNTLVGNQGVFSPYLWEVAPQFLRKLLFGFGVLELVGAAFLCLYFIFAAYISVIITQMSSINYILNVDSAAKGLTDSNHEKTLLMEPIPTNSTVSNRRGRSLWPHRGVEVPNSYL